MIEFINHIIGAFVSSKFHAVAVAKNSLFIELRSTNGLSFDLTEGIMIHGGGWKKLISEEVDSSEFRDCLKKVCGIEHIHDYYGMVEQTGCIYMQCECGHFHASIFSDVVPKYVYQI